MVDPPDVVVDEVVDLEVVVEVTATEVLGASPK